MARDNDADFGAAGVVEEDLTVGDYKAPGIHLDADGEQHTLPIGATQVNISDNDPLWVPNRAKREAEGFYQYFEHVTNVPQAIAKGFRPVTRREAGFPTVAGLPTEYGLDAGDVPHRLHDLVLMEGPMSLYERIDKERQRTAREAIQPILRTAKKVELEDSATGNRIEDFREASVTGKRIRDIQSTSK